MNTILAGMRVGAASAAAAGCQVAFRGFQAVIYALVWDRPVLNAV